MKRGRPSTKITKNCVLCNKIFKVIKCREFKAKFCCHTCSETYSKGKLAWNSGKTYEEMYSPEETNRIKNIQSIRSSGKNNPIYGKPRSEETKRKISLANKGHTGGWMKGKKFPGLFSYQNRFGKNNALVKHILKKENITYEEYEKRVGEFKTYQRMVIYITSQQPIHLLENYEKRGKAPGKDIYHLDHIYPISIGFKNKIPPEIIGDISNLRFIHWKENLQKSNKIIDENIILNGNGI